MFSNSGIVITGLPNDTKQSDAQQLGVTIKINRGSIKPGGKRNENEADDSPDVGKRISQRDQVFWLVAFFRLIQYFFRLPVASSLQ